MANPTRPRRPQLADRASETQALTWVEIARGRLVVPFIIRAAALAHVLARREEEAFGQEHERTYGHRAGTEEPVELVAIQLVGSGLRGGGEVPPRVTSSRTEPAEQDARQAYFGEEHGWIDTPVLRRADLDIKSRRVGPLIVEEYDATCLIPPGAHADFDATGNIVLEL